MGSLPSGCPFSRAKRLANSAARAFALEPLRKLPDLSHPFLVPQLPRCLHQRFDLVLLIFRHTIHHVPQLMLPAALDVILAAEYGIDRGAQRLGTIDHKQPLAIGMRMPGVPLKVTTPE
jgi:hypothetical protein